MTSAKITNDQIKDAVRRSGYLLEYRVEQILNRSGYLVQANEVYPDPLTGKARELDITAIAVESIFSSDFKDTIWQRLLIECVNNSQPIAFFTKPAPAPTAHIYDLKFSGIPVKIKKGKTWEKLSEFLNMQEYHHHCRGRIATQYCSFTAKKNTNPMEWLAQHEDLHFDSFNKLCFALNHEIDDHYSHTHLYGKESVNVQMYSPILVVAGDLVEIIPNRRKIEIRNSNHIHFVQSHISNGKSQNYHIDVVTEKYLPKLLAKIQEEVGRTGRRMRRKAREIQTNVNRLATAGKSIRSKNAIRGLLEYRGPWGRDEAR